MSDDVKEAGAGTVYRGDDEQFAAHEVEEAHGAGAVSVGQQGAVMAPRHPSPLGVRVLWHCNRQEKINTLKKEEDLKAHTNKKTGEGDSWSQGYPIKSDEKTLRMIPWCSVVRL